LFFLFSNLRQTKEPISIAGRNFREPPFKTDRKRRPQFLDIEVWLDAFLVKMIKIVIGKE
jgi:hypothetical protein